MTKVSIGRIIEGPVEEWIKAARSGSLDSLGRALEANRPYLVRVAASEMGSDLQVKESVSDLVQETFLEAYRDFGRFTGRTGPEWTAWLRRILLNNLGHTARRYRGAGKRQIRREVPIHQLGSCDDPEIGLEADAPSPSGDAMRHELLDALHQVVGRLPDRERQLLLWRIEEQQTFEAIGRRLGCSAVAARKAWLRAIEQLRRGLNSLASD